MITRRIIPNVVTFNALIDSFVKEGKLVEAKELYNEMMQEDYVRKAHCPKLTCCLERWERMGLHHSGTYNTLIRAHLGGSGLTTSVELIEEMKSVDSLQMLPP
ncbi:unnamed protein product [Microthlaspi erraticum]|uniref:Pentacotripeptide-repeat region of PRORP domain-containing protein n=1 Tax=Microthlaspi erraticum TaxID=1685480 RepID=A0A6D2J9P5_9BRAS|nr:unnamed protein product [Microthlaspi erraticum]